MKLKLVRGKSFALLDSKNKKTKMFCRAGDIIDVPMHEAEYLLGTGLFTADLDEPVYDEEEEEAVREACEEANRAFQKYRQEALRG